MRNYITIVLYLFSFTFPIRGHGQTSLRRESEGITVISYLHDSSNLVIELGEDSIFTIFRRITPHISAGHLLFSGYFKINKQTLTVKDDSNIIEMKFILNNRDIVCIKGFNYLVEKIFKFEYKRYKYKEETYPKSKLCLEQLKNLKHRDSSSHTNFIGKYIPGGEPLAADTSSWYSQIILEKEKYKIYYFGNLWMTGRILRTSTKELALENPFGTIPFTFKRYNNNLILPVSFFNNSFNCLYHKVGSF